MFSKSSSNFPRWHRQPSRVATKTRGAVRTLLSASALAGLLLAVMASAAQASQDSVRGTARHLGADPPFPVIQVRVNASADATGLNPRGHLSVDAEGIHSYTGNVTCLNVIGSQASIGIEIVKFDAAP